MSTALPSFRQGSYPTLSLTSRPTPSSSATVQSSPCTARAIRIIIPSTQATVLDPDWTPTHGHGDNVPSSPTESSEPRTLRHMSVRVRRRNSLLSASSSADDADAGSQAAGAGVGRLMMLPLEEDEGHEHEMQAGGDVNGVHIASAGSSADRAHEDASRSVHA
ncbi:hypothetical protein TRAPUB_11741 [Trametes pubescens]|uniref:Uncharacterized protein n=1 Tax=Trametes pubescens TaxID=154538 RepID=A0A1M2VVY2_TRAPU|nr:hypothetical protein TRAPUB_11741 [Trametes pubescens]